MRSDRASRTVRADMDADPDDAQRGAIPRLGRDAVGHYGAMTTYDGPATAIASGIEYPVTASPCHREQGKRQDVARHADRRGRTRPPGRSSTMKTLS